MALDSPRRRNCQSTDEQKRKDAIIVLAAKLKGAQDSLEQYKSYLKGAKIYSSMQGKSVKSEPKYARQISIGTTTPLKMRRNGR